MSTLKTNEIQTTGGQKLLGSSGSIIQYVQSTKTDTFYSNTADGNWTDVTGMTATITPNNSSNKILVKCFLGKISGLNNNTFRILRGTSIPSVIGDTDGSRTRALFSDSNQGRDANHTGSAGFEFVDSPSTTSSTTYKLQVMSENISGQGFGLNRTHSNTNNTNGYNARCASTMILMEIVG